jgi:hypothetical protein
MNAMKALKEAGATSAKWLTKLHEEEEGAVGGIESVMMIAVAAMVLAATLGFTGVDSKGTSSGDGLMGSISGIVGKLLKGAGGGVLDWAGGLLG